MNVDKILEGLGEAATAIGRAVGGRTGDAFQVAGALTEGVASLLDTRTPEQVIELLQELNEQPARRVSLSKTRDRVAAILARRRTEDGA